MLTEFWAHKGWIALIPLALAALAFYAWIAIGADARAMDRRGIETEGTIVDTRRIVRPVTTGTGSGTVARLSYNYFVTVMFSTGAVLEETLDIREVEQSVDRAYYDAASTGDRVWMRYLPGDPPRIELQRGGTQSNSTAAGWVALGMAASAVFLGWLLWMQAAKVHRFKTLGTPTEATITDITVQNSWTILTLALPDGRSVKALPVKAQDGQFAPGAPLTVLTVAGQANQVMIPPAR